jgi:hypothetical protein
MKYPLTAALACLIAFLALSSPAFCGENADNRSELEKRVLMEVDWGTITRIADEAIKKNDDYRYAVKAYEYYLKDWPQSPHAPEAKQKIEEYSKRITALENVPLTQVAYLDNVQWEERREVGVVVKPDNSSAVGFAFYVNGKNLDNSALLKRMQLEAMMAGYENPKRRISNLRVIVLIDKSLPMYAFQSALEPCIWNMIYRIAIAAEIPADNASGKPARTGIIEVPLPIEFIKREYGGPEIDLGELRIRFFGVNSEKLPVRSRRLDEKFEDYTKEIKCAGISAKTYEKNLTKGEGATAIPDFDAIAELIKTSKADYNPPKAKPDKTMPLIIDAGELVPLEYVVKVIALAKSLGIKEIFFAAYDIPKFRPSQGGINSNHVAEKPVVILDDIKERSTADEDAKASPEEKKMWNLLKEYAALYIRELNDYASVIKACRFFLEKFPDGAYAAKAKEMISVYEKELKKIEDASIVPLPQCDTLDNLSWDNCAEITVVIKPDNSSERGYYYYINGIAHIAEGLAQKMQVVKEYAPKEDSGKGFSTLRVIVKSDRTVPMDALHNLFRACLKNMIYKTAFAAEAPGEGNSAKTGLVALYFPNKPDDSRVIDFGMAQIQLKAVGKDGKNLRKRGPAEKFKNYIKEAIPAGSKAVIGDSIFQTKGASGSEPDYAQLAGHLKQAAADYKPPKNDPSKKMPAGIYAAELVQTGHFVRTLSVLKSLGLTNVSVAAPDIPPDSDIEEWDKDDSDSGDDWAAPEKDKPKK